MTQGKKKINPKFLPDLLESCWHIFIPYQTKCPMSHPETWTNDGV